MYEAPTKALLDGDIDKDEFERRCKQEWIDASGPVPEGRELVVGVVPERGVVVGHVEAW